MKRIAYHARVWVLCIAVCALLFCVLFSSVFSEYKILPMLSIIS